MAESAVGSLVRSTAYSTARPTGYVGRVFLQTVLIVMNVVVYSRYSPRPVKTGEAELSAAAKRWKAIDGYYPWVANKEASAQWKADAKLLADAFVAQSDLPPAGGVNESVLGVETEGGA